MASSPSFQHFIACLIALHALNNLENGCANIKTWTVYAVKARVEQTSLNASANFKEYCQLVEAEALQLFEDCNIIDQAMYHKRGAALLQKICIVIINVVQNQSFPEDPTLQRKCVAILAFSKTSGKVDIKEFEDEMYDALSSLFGKSDSMSVNWSSGSGFNLALNNSKSEKTKNIYVLSAILGRYKAISL
jgi:hypothetical protein